MARVVKAAIAGALVLAFAAGCGEPDERSAIRTAFERGVAAAEAGDAAALAALLADDYNDPRGRDKRMLSGELAFMMQGREIHVWQRERSLTLEGPVAESSHFAAVGGRPVDRQSLLEGAEAEMGRLDLIWIRHRGRWLVRSADWNSVSLEELF